jgi:hypothetical protein
MAVETDLYKYFVNNLNKVQLSKKELAKPDSTLEEEVTKIFKQAHSHRGWLVNFYIGYTSASTIFVFVLIGLQAHYRIIWQDSHFEIIPQWALNLLVTGMFGQFVGLLTIVTQRVWDFKPFFTYHNRIRNGHTDSAPGAESNHDYIKPK